MFLIAATSFHASTAAVQNGTLDQQQAVINTAEVVLVIGGLEQQRLAQVVTAGRSGTLNQIALVVACASQIQLVVQIQGVSSDKPNGTVLASYIFNNIGLYANPPAFKTLTLDNPLSFNAGDRFAIVLSSTPPNPNFICSTYPGPVGNPYPGGDAFVNSISDPPGQWTLIGQGIHPIYGADLPFQTFVIPPKTFTVPPCRVLDTRLSDPLGPVPGNATRSILVAGDLTAGGTVNQGGATCGVPDIATAIFANVIAVNADGPGHLTAYPFGTTLPVASTLNFTTGQTIANGVLVPTCTPVCAFDLNITMGPAAAHVVIDVTGYLQPTP